MLIAGTGLIQELMSQTVTLATHRYMKKPLRKVIREVVVEYEVAGQIVRRPRELLECGHINRIPTDWYGETYAERRRCRKCGQGLPPDPSPKGNESSK